METDILIESVHKPAKNIHQSFFNTHKNLLKFIFVLLFCVIVNFDLYSYEDKNVSSFKFHVPIENIPKSEHLNSSIKYILFWTPFWHFYYWNMGAEILEEKYLKSIDCPVTNCIFSHKRDFLPKTTDYDAVIFHMGLYNHTDIDDMPEARRDDQLYIVANEE